MSNQVLDQTGRVIPIYELFAFVFESVVKARLRGADGEKVMTEERVKAYTTTFINANQLSVASDCRSLSEESINGLSEESFQELFSKSLGDGDFEDFKNAFRSETQRIVNLVQLSDQEREVSFESEKTSVRIILRIFNELYRRVTVILDNSDTVKSYIYGLKMIHGLGIPASEGEYKELMPENQVLVSIQRGIERLNLPPLLNDNEILKYYVMLPNINQVTDEVNEVVDQGQPVPETEKMIKSIKSQYRASDTLSVFLNTAYIQDILNLLSKNDLHRAGLKNLLLEWQSEISPRKNDFDDLISFKIDELKAKKMGMGESMMRVYTFLITQIDSGIPDEDIVKQNAQFFAVMYNGVLKDHHLPVDDKMNQLNEIVSNKQKFNSAGSLADLKIMLENLKQPKLDLDKLFFE
ncbi:MAG: hypothetical protein OEZ36_06455, partial [Spirochaetota bacterium]|nr:hypothetical protein [Spirochaetota bacterium]